MKRLLLAFATCLAATTFGCGADPNAPATFVGDVEGTDVRVGVVTENGKVAMFFCGGPTSLDASTRWLRGASPPSALDLTAQSWTAKGTASGASASGTVDRGDGKALRWTARRVGEDGLPGLYELVDAEGTAGVVVLDADHAQGAFIPKTGAVQQIEAIRPVRTNDTVEVRVVGAAPRTIVVRRVRAQ